MDQLRFVLIVFGVALIIGIFVWELFKKRAAQRRRAQIFEHLAEEERGALTGESVLGDIDQADPFDIVGRAQDRRAAGDSAYGDDRYDDLGDDPGDGARDEHLHDYDIDEDFPADAAEAVTQTPMTNVSTPPPAHPVTPDAGGEGKGLSGLAARRDGPEQLDLAGLELSAPARGGETVAKRQDKARANRRQSDKTRSQANDEELHIVMTVMAGSGAQFSGAALRHALERVRLYHGEMSIFHRHEEPEDQHSRVLFSVANVLAPGTFEPAGMDALSSPGIAMFMRLPGPEHPADAFQQMLEAAKSVAQELDGKVCDESRSTLTPQSINHLRERIADFSRRQMIKA